jgi:hypothetical protein
MKLTTSEPRTYQGDAVLTVVLRQRVMAQTVDDKGQPIGEPMTVQAPHVSVTTTDGKPLLSREMTDKEYDEYSVLVQALLGERERTEPEVVVSEPEARVTVERVASAIDSGIGGMVRP